ncbi:hypothetical protein ACP70R_000163 [Stipagrostis hirtigluma subsp. patula]
MARVLRRAQPLIRRLLRPPPPLFPDSPSSTSALGCCNQRISHMVQSQSMSTEGREQSKAEEDGCSEKNIKQKDFALQQALDQITSAFGEESIMWLSQSYGRKEVPCVSTGSFALDIALGIGGLPKGRVVEIYGPEASGKTTLALHVIAEAQKSGARTQVTGACLAAAVAHVADLLLTASLAVVNNLCLPHDDTTITTLGFRAPRQLQQLFLTVLVQQAMHAHSRYCAFIDAEHALDPSLAESIGVKSERLLLSQPDCGEQALGLADILIRSGSIDVVVVDSVAALVPKTELDGEMGDAHVALQARLMSQALRKLSHSLSRSRTLLLFVNQVRSKLSSFSGFGAPAEVTCGGNALKFYASVRLNTKRIGLITKGEEVVGTQIQVRIVKNKHAPPFKTVQLELEFGKGLSRESEIIDLGCKHKLITKSGVFYHMNGKNFHGKDAIKRYLTENRDAEENLMVLLREKITQKEARLDRDTEDIDPGRSLTEETVSASDEEVHDELEA